MIFTTINGAHVLAGTVPARLGGRPPTPGSHLPVVCSCRLFASDYYPGRKFPHVDYYTAMQMQLVVSPW